MTRWRIPPAELAALLLGVLIGAYLLGYPSRLVFTPDAHEYVAFSDAILDGGLFSRRGSEVSKDLATRTPGYPLVIAAVRALGAGSESAVRAIHAALGLAALLCVPLLLRSQCPVWLSASGVLVALYCMRSYYARPITEWLSLVLLLFLFALCARHVENPGPRRLLAIGLTSAAIVLTRPALIAAGLFPFGFALLRGGSVRLRALAVSVSLAPVLLWMGFNLYRLGSFTLTPFTGPNLFGVAALVGHATPRAGDDPELVRFIEEVNRGKKPPPGERVRLDRLERPAYDQNIHKLAEPIASEHGYDWMDFNRMLLVYSSRSLRAHPREYLAYVLFGLEKVLPDLALLFVPACVLPVYWLVRGRHRGLALATLALLGLHLAHMLLCASMEIMLPRYRMLTSCPLHGCALVLGGVFLLDLARTAGRRFRRRRPSVAQP
jgi:hypothetical protein